MIRDLLPFVIAGLATGSVHALNGIGLVVAYKTSGVLNFAHGSLATVAAYVFFELFQRRDVPWPVAGLVTVAVVGCGGGLGFARLAARIANVETTLQVIATVGIAVAVQGLAVAWYGGEPRRVDPFLPTSTFAVAGVNVGWDQLLLCVLALVLAIGLASFFRWTRNGLAMRAIVEDPDLLSLCRVPQRRVRGRAWMIGSVLAASTGVLLVPTIGLDSTILTLLVVQAFGAAAVGAFSNVWLTYVGGLVVGVGQAVLTKYASDLPQIRGLPPSFPFIVLFVVLLATPRRRLAASSRQHLHRVRAQRPLTLRANVVLVTVVAVALLLVPQIAGSRLPLWMTGLAFSMMFASLQLLVRTGGQVSLCHPTFVAIGAATFANLTGGFGWPWLAALLIAGLAAVPVGAFVAIPAIRLSGLYLAVATFGFGLLIEQAFYRKRWMFGTFNARTARRPVVLGLDLTSDRSFFYVVLVMFVLVVITVLCIQRGRLGRLLKALANSPTALESYGANANVTRVLLFCVSAFLAAVAGAAYAATSVTVSSSALTSNAALLWLVVLVFAATIPRIGSGVVGVSLAAGIMLVVVPGYIRNGTVLDYQPVLFGVSSIFVAMTAAGEVPNRRRAPTPASAGSFAERDLPVASPVEALR